MRVQITDNYFMETAQDSDDLHYYLFEKLTDVPGHCRCVCDGLTKTEKESQFLCRLWIRTNKPEKENHD